MEGFVRIEGNVWLVEIVKIVRIVGFMILVVVRPTKNKSRGI